MARGCCPPKGIRIIRVGDFEAGVKGLEQVLEKAYQQGWLPEQEGLGKALVEGLRAAGNYIGSKVEAAYGEALTNLYREYFEAATSVTREGGGRMKIEILGPGCPRCRATQENVRQALTELNLEADIVHISDPREFLRRGVLLTPGVIIDGELKVSGRVPEKREIKAWFTKQKAF